MLEESAKSDLVSSSRGSFIRALAKLPKTEFCTVQKTVLGLSAKRPETSRALSLKHFLGILIMLGQGCLSALSWRAIYFCLKWVEDGFLSMGWHGSKKWVLGCKNVPKVSAQAHFSPTLNPFRDCRENALFSQDKGGGNSFPKRALRQSRPSITFWHLYQADGIAT